MTSAGRQVSIQWDDEEYELTVVSYSPPTADTRDEPGDGGEIDFSPTVRIANERMSEEITFDEFLDRFATHHGTTREKADSCVRDQAMFEIADMVAADYEDSLESFLEDQ